MTTITIDPSRPTRATQNHHAEDALPTPKKTHTATANGGHASSTRAQLLFIGTATTLIRFAPLTILTDPNFLHAGDHVHLGPGVNATRKTDPYLDLQQLPNVDLVLLSHYHEDHFDRKVESDLNRDLPIVTTPHAKECLVDKKGDDDRFNRVTALEPWDTATVDVVGEQKTVGVTAVPGKHVPPGFLETANELLGAVPPTNGWIVELTSSRNAQNCYRIYITGDTLLVDDLKTIPERYSKAGRPIDLMLAHLGGTTIPSPSIPLLMVTMDAKMGVDLIKMIQPEITIPIHFDDYDVFASPLSDFRDAVREAGLEDKVIFLDRGDAYEFEVN